MSHLKFGLFLPLLRCDDGQVFSQLWRSSGNGFGIVNKIGDWCLLLTLVSAARSVGSTCQGHVLLRAKYRVVSDSKSRNLGSRL
jgi:hypothetical protein